MEKQSIQPNYSNTEDVPSNIEAEQHLLGSVMVIYYEQSLIHLLRLEYLIILFLMKGTPIAFLV